MTKFWVYLTISIIVLISIIILTYGAKKAYIKCNTDKLNRRTEAPITFNLKQIIPRIELNPTDNELEGLNQNRRQPANTDAVIQLRG